MRVEHPLAGDGTGVPPATVDVNGDTVPVDDDTFEVPDGARGWLQQFAGAYDVDPDDIVYKEDGSPDGDEDADTNTEAETCDTVKSDGEVCGRELPCAYHSDDAETTDEES
jgi:hypothetical protein